jgi:hypothetical protein
MWVNMRSSSAWSNISNTVPVCWKTRIARRLVSDHFQFLARVIGRRLSGTVFCHAKIS